MSNQQQARQHPISRGKYRRLRRLTDDEGRFAMLAVDQRGSLRRMIAPLAGVASEEVAPDDLRQVKRIVTEAIAPLATGVLTDPLYGYPASFDVVPSGVGVLLAAEKTGYTTDGAAERRSSLLDEWGVERILRDGADAVKLLIYHTPQASPATQEHQAELVESVGEACAAEDVPFILEVLTYATENQKVDPGAKARRKPALVADAARTYSAPRFQVDVLKLEFPADLKYTEEYQDTDFGAGEVAYDRAAVAKACQQLDEAAGVPWVILSAGVDVEEFVENLRLANAAGASGFLCGRAVWKHVVDHYPDGQRMRSYMQQDGQRLFESIRQANADALPWHRHPSVTPPEVVGAG